MATKQYSFYPGCSSERKASAANYMVSVESMCKTLDVKLNEIPDWNCCGASIGYAEGGELPRHIMNARNIALSEQHNPKLPGSMRLPPSSSLLTCRGIKPAFCDSVST